MSRYFFQTRVNRPAEIMSLSVLRCICMGSRWNASLRGSSTVPACLDHTRGGFHDGLLEGPVPPAFNLVLKG